MKHDLAKMKESLDNIESLIKEVSSGYFIPKKFRKKPFTETIRNQYVAYLEDEADRVGALIESYQHKPTKVIAPRVITPVQMNAAK